MLTAKNQEKRFWQNLFVAVCLCAVSTALIAAQSSNPTENVVLVRNARVADCESDRLVEATVLVSGGKMTLVEAANESAAGAVVIDGGGNILTLGTDGRIILRSEKENASFRYQPKSPEMDAAIALAAGELYENRAPIYPSDFVNSDCLSFRFGGGKFLGSNNLSSGQFKGKITGNTKDNLPPLCKDAAAKRANIEFVACATKRGGAAFVPVYDRIADFGER
jgi:hypothetical protein